jgi:hypothetical protein
MQLGGPPVRVRLTTDLTRYDNRCVNGSMGTTIPNRKFGVFGNYDHFVAVRFDNGAMMDISYGSIEIIKEETDLV